jgi:hypothetical protein
VVDKDEAKVVQMMTGEVRYLGGVCATGMATWSGRCKDDEVTTRPG